MNNKVTMGSLFDGIGGFLLAALKNQINSVWASEIEPFPIAITKEHFPTIKHLGNILNIDGKEIPNVDIVTAGSPCQDLSIAGNRVGLSGERSSLFMEMIRFVKEMRENDRQQGRSDMQIRPRILFWENVPGVFSSNKGEDFRRILEEICKIKDETISIPMPPKEKWQKSGCIVGEDFSLAWRVLNAQYFGVAQRRRRVFLVADFGGKSAPQVLFECYSMSGDTSQGESEGERASGAIERSIRDTIEYEYNQRIDFAGGFYYKNSSKYGIAYQSEISPTIKTDSAIAVHKKFKNESNKNSVPAVLPFDTSFCTSPNNHSNPKYGDVCHTLSSNSHVPKVSVSYCLAGNTINREEKNGGNGKGFQENISYTLNTSDKHVVYCTATQQGGAETLKNISPTITESAGKSGNNQPWIMDMSHADEVIRDCGNASPTLNSRMGTGGNQVPIVLNSRTKSLSIQKNMSNTLTATDYKGPQCVAKPVYSIDREGFNQGKNALFDFKIHDDNKTSSLIARGPSAVYNPCKKSFIRKLTPLECERLQGFPDFWTTLKKKESMTKQEYSFWSEVYKNYRKFIKKPVVKNIKEDFILKWYNKLDSDSARYKAIGNSVAIPCVNFIMKRIKKIVYEGR